MVGEWLEIGWRVVGELLEGGWSSGASLAVGGLCVGRFPIIINRNILPNEVKGTQLLQKQVL